MTLLPDYVKDRIRIDRDRALVAKGEKSGSRAFGYIRVSTEGQVDGDSLIAQERAITDYYERKLSPMGVEFAGCVEDHVSASKVPFSEREGGRYLLGELKAGDHLIVFRQDRFSRNLRDALNQVEYFTNKGIKFHLIELGQLGLSESDPIIFAMLTMGAEVEARNKSRRQTQHNNSNRESGNYAYKRVSPWVAGTELAGWENRVFGVRMQRLAADRVRLFMCWAEFWPAQVCARAAGVYRTTYKVAGIRARANTTGNVNRVVADVLGIPYETTDFKEKNLLPWPLISRARYTKIAFKPNDPKYKSHNAWTMYLSELMAILPEPPRPPVASDQVKEVPWVDMVTDVSTGAILRWDYLYEPAESIFQLPPGMRVFSG